jgi:uncharacterized protein YjbJ (UPF0337 family)
MGELTDKTKAAGNKIAGSIKDSIGEATNDPHLKAEGEAQKAKGTAQDVSGTIKGKLGNEI